MVRFFGHDLPDASFSSILRRIVHVPLEESGFHSVVNNTFLSFGVRDKKPHERGGGNEESFSLINPGGRGAAGSADGGVPGGQGDQIKTSMRQQTTVNASMRTK
jgi:hypothetical protein